MKEKVSICIPVYNAENTIVDTLYSAINQTYKNIEILIIDNCSEDNTVSIIKNIEDDRIVFFQNDTNIGMTANWNECIKKSTGEYIHFLCADDYIDPECIEKKIAAFNRDEEIVLVTSARDVVDDNNVVIHKRQFYNKNVIVEGKKFAKKSLFIGNIFGEPSCVMFKKRVLKKTGNFSDNLCYTTDWELWIRIASTGKIAYLSRSLTKFRISVSSITSSIRLGRVLEDDKNMINNLIDNNTVKISCGDYFIHRAVLTVRDVIRLFFVKTIKMKGILNKIADR